MSDTFSILGQQAKLAFPGEYDDLDDADLGKRIHSNPIAMAKFQHAKMREEAVAQEAAQKAERETLGGRTASMVGYVSSLPGVISDVALTGGQNLNLDEESPAGFSLRKDIGHQAQELVQRVAAAAGTGDVSQLNTYANKPIIGEEEHIKKEFREDHPVLAGAEAVAKPLGRAAVSLYTDPLIKVMGVAGKGGKLARLAGGAAGAAFIPGMVQGAMENAEKAREDFAAGGDWTKGLEEATEAATDLGFAGLGAKHLVGGVKTSGKMVQDFRTARARAAAESKPAGGVGAPDPAVPGGMRIQEVGKDKLPVVQGTQRTPNILRRALAGGVESAGKIAGATLGGKGGYVGAKLGWEAGARLTKGLAAKIRGAHTGEGLRENPLRTGTELNEFELDALNPENIRAGELKQYDRTGNVVNKPVAASGEPIVRTGPDRFADLTPDELAAGTNEPAYAGEAQPYGMPEGAVPPVDPIEAAKQQAAHLEAQNRLTRAQLAEAKLRDQKAQLDRMQALAAEHPDLPGLVESMTPPKGPLSYEAALAQARRAIAAKNPPSVQPEARVPEPAAEPQRAMGESPLEGLSPEETDQLLGMLSPEVRGEAPLTDAEAAGTLAEHAFPENLTLDQARAALNALPPEAQPRPDLNPAEVAAADKFQTAENVPAGEVGRTMAEAGVPEPEISKTEQRAKDLGLSRMDVDGHPEYDRTMEEWKNGQLTTRKKVDGKVQDVPLPYDEKGGHVARAIARNRVVDAIEAEREAAKQQGQAEGLQGQSPEAVMDQIVAEMKGNPGAIRARLVKNGITPDQINQLLPGALERYKAGKAPKAAPAPAPEPAPAEPQGVGEIEARFADQGKLSLDDLIALAQQYAGEKPVEPLPNQAAIDQANVESLSKPEEPPVVSEPVQPEVAPVAPEPPKKAPKAKKGAEKAPVEAVAPPEAPPEAPQAPEAGKAAPAAPEAAGEGTVKKGKWAGKNVGDEVEGGRRIVGVDEDGWPIVAKAKGGEGLAQEGGEGKDIRRGMLPSEVREARQKAAVRIRQEMVDKGWMTPEGELTKEGKAALASPKGEGLASLATEFANLRGTGEPLPESETRVGPATRALGGALKEAREATARVNVRNANERTLAEISSRQTDLAPETRFTKTEHGWEESDSLQQQRGEGPGPVRTGTQIAIANLENARRARPGVKGVLEGKVDTTPRLKPKEHPVAKAADDAAGHDNSTLTPEQKQITENTTVPLPKPGFELPAESRIEGKTPQEGLMSTGTWRGDITRGLKSGKEAFIAQAKRVGLTQKEIDRALEGIDFAALLAEMKPNMMPRDTLYNPAGGKLSAVRPNQDFGTSLDFDTNCPRAVGTNALIDAIQKQSKTVLTRNERISLQLMLRSGGLTPECLYCYALEGRLKAADFAKRAATEGFTLAKGKPNEKTWGPIDEKYLVDENAAKNAPPELQEHIAAAKKYIQGAKANVVKPFTPYQGEYLSEKNLPKEMVDRVNARWGMRLNSNTDFKPYHALDLMQAIADASTRGIKMHVYTKELDMLLGFGDTGIKFNLSLAGNGDGKGGIKFDARQGMDPEIVKWAHKNYKNAGGMLVALDKDAVIAAMRPENEHIGQIIPGHLGLTKGEQAALGWESQKGQQHERPLTKGELKPGQKPGEGSVQREVHKDDLETFLRANEERGLRPRFAEYVYELDKNGHIQRGTDGQPIRRWTGTAGLKNTSELMQKAGVKGWDDPKAVQKYGAKMEQGYMKLVRDFARVDTPFEGVKPKFNTKHIEQTFKEWLDAGVSAEEVPVDQKMVDEFLKLRGEGKLPTIDKPNDWAIRKPLPREQRLNVGMRERSGEVPPEYSEEEGLARLRGLGELEVPTVDGKAKVKSYDSGTPGIRITERIGAPGRVTLTHEASGNTFGVDVPRGSKFEQPIKELAARLGQIIGPEGMADSKAITRAQGHQINALVDQLNASAPTRRAARVPGAPKRESLWKRIERKMQENADDVKQMMPKTGEEAKQMAKDDPIGFTLMQSVNYLFDNMNRTAWQTEIGKQFGPEKFDPTTQSYREGTPTDELYQGGFVQREHAAPDWSGLRKPIWKGGSGQLEVSRSASITEVAAKAVRNSEIGKDLVERRNAADKAGENGTAYEFHQRLQGIYDRFLERAANGDEAAIDALMKPYKESLKQTLAHEMLHGFRGSSDTGSPIMQRKMNQSADAMLDLPTKEGSTLRQELDRYFDAKSMDKAWRQEIQDRARDAIKGYGTKETNYASNKSVSLKQEGGFAAKMKREGELVSNAGKTAIARTKPSTPAGLWADHVKGKTVFDWGAGKGADMKHYEQAGATDVKGYDPNHMPEKPEGMADVVTNTYVANVLPPAPRKAMLIEAYARAKDKLLVSVRSDKIKGEPYEDGVVTSTGTFQKSYKPGELVEELKKLFPAATVEAGPKVSGASTAIVTRVKGKMPRRRQAFEKGMDYNRRKDVARYAPDQPEKPIDWDSALKAMGEK